MSLRESVTNSLDALEVDDRDGAARDLAVLYATEIDGAPELLEQLGPKLLATLEALGMTPRARSAATKGAPGAAVNPLDQLQRRRAERTAG
jgi:hypothetical protein